MENDFSEDSIRQDSKAEYHHGQPAIIPKEQVIAAIDNCRQNKDICDEDILSNPVPYEDLDMNLETRAAVEYLQHSDDIHISSLTIVGHSVGADPALSTGISEASINGIVVIGPPRRVNERFHFSPDRDFFWNWAIQVRKKVYGKTRFPDWYSKEVWVEQIMDRDICFKR